MATRPVFVPVGAAPWVRVMQPHFEWFPGFSLTQARRNVQALHASAVAEGAGRILEVSSRSEDQYGRELSAFRLAYTFRTSGRRSPVESVFQGSKTFESGGPYTDLYDRDAKAAKRDERIRKSGALVAFSLEGEKWDLRFGTAFYDWVYLNALVESEHLLSYALKFDAFTDIAFNPKKSVNCQARALALGVALSRSAQLSKALECRRTFLEVAFQRDSTERASQGELPF